MLLFNGEGRGGGVLSLMVGWLEWRCLLCSLREKLDMVFG